MHKRFLFFLGFLIATNLCAQHNSQRFAEVNLGLTAIDTHIFSGGNTLPEGSLMIGLTKQSSDKFVTEFQIGGAFPSFVSAKLAAGTGTVNKNIMLAVRPWPFMIGPQVRRNRCTYSLEFGTTNAISYDAGTIATVGYRWNLTTQKERAPSSNGILRPLKTITATSIIGVLIGMSAGLSDHT